MICCDPEPRRPAGPGGAPAGRPTGGARYVSSLSPFTLKIPLGPSVLAAGTSAQTDEFSSSPASYAHALHLSNHQWVYTMNTCPITNKFTHVKDQHDQFGHNINTHVRICIAVYAIHLACILVRENIMGKCCADSLYWVLALCSVRYTQNSYAVLCIGQYKFLHSVHFPKPTKHAQSPILCIIKLHLQNVLKGKLLTGTPVPKIWLHCKSHSQLSLPR